LREPFAEFLGTAVLMIFGNGINVQVTVSKLYDASDAKGDYLSISFGWGLGVLFGVTLAGGISGGHINPALTLALAVWRRFPWRKVPVYICAQMAGALVGSLMIYGLYVVPIRIVDPMQTETTAALFTTYPAEFLRTQSTRITTFYNEVFATAVLAAVVFALGDSNNTPPPEGMAPLILMWLIMAIGATLGWQSAYCVNPARDWGPRMMLSMVGYQGLWSFNAGYFAWTPLLATVVGAQVGAFLYDALIYTGGDSPLNRPWRWNRVKWPSTSRHQLPASVS
ncbi:aquaporin, partial [Ceraceosorus guamensis]